MLINIFQVERSPSGMLRFRVMAEGRDATRNAHICAQPIGTSSGMSRLCGRSFFFIWIFLHLLVKRRGGFIYRNHLSTSWEQVKFLVEPVGAKIWKNEIKYPKIIQNQVRFEQPQGHLTAVNDWLLIEFLLQTPHILFQPWLTKRTLT